MEVCENHFRKEIHLNFTNKRAQSQSVQFCFAPHQVYTVGPSGTSLLMWAATGNHGRQWTYANVILSNPAPFRVTFQAEVGGDVWTDIALDDVSYTAECVVGGKAKVLSVVSFCPCTSIRFLVFSSFPVLSAPAAHFPWHILQFSPSLVSSFSTFSLYQHPCSPALFPYKLCGPTGGV